MSWTVDAVEAAHIVDVITGPERGKGWRVAFYWNMRQHSVVPQVLTKTQATRAAAAHAGLMIAAQNEHVKRWAKRV